MDPDQIDAPFHRGFVSLPEQRARPPIFLIPYETDLRHIIVWLVRECGYRALTRASCKTAESLLSADRAVMVVSELGTPFWASSDILAFCHRQFPDAPVVIASRDALGKLPAVQHWIGQSLGERCAVARFQTELQVRMGLEDAGKHLAEG